MQRQGQGVLIDARPHGETSCIVTLFTENDGLLSGLVKGGRKKKADLTLGNIVQFMHQRRLESQLGTLRYEVLISPAIYVFEHIAGLKMLGYQCGLMKALLQEGVAQPKFYDRTTQMLKTIARHEDRWQRLARWEVDILHAVGFGLSLQPQEAVPCPENSPLYYVSPRTGRAVSQAMGAPYHHKMLLLPKFFGGQEGGILDVFKLTGHFLKHAMAELAPYGTLSPRDQLLDLVAEKMHGTNTGG